jgi:hypothetical protein
LEQATQSWPSPSSTDDFVIRFFDETLSTRLDDKRRGRIVGPALKFSG